MLELTASRTVKEPEYRILETQVVLHNYSKLTPRVARAALQIAFGNDSGGDVWDHAAGYGYRVYENSERKLRGEQ
jgi:hypothetical protein